MIRFREYFWVTATVLLMHAAFWLYPITSGGIANLLAFIAWFMALVLLFGAIASIFMGAHKSRWKFPKPIRSLLSLSRWASIVWMVYHGAFALALVLIIASCLYLLAVNASKETMGAS